VLAAVVLVEDPMLDPDVQSSQGAVGLMQVMPFHAGRWDCGSADLTDLDANVCHGARIFRDYLVRAGGNIDRALLAYNGCVRGLNTPDCHKYPSHVYSNAGRAALRSWLHEH
jgi:soluble lytic murein transglycosylase-like protein